MPRAQVVLRLQHRGQRRSVVRACALTRILLPEFLSRRPPRPPGRSRLTRVSSPPALPSAVRQPSCCPPRCSAVRVWAASYARSAAAPRPPCSGPCRGSGTDVLHLRLTHAGSDARGARDPILDPSPMWPKIRAPSPQVGDSHSKTRNPPPCDPGCELPTLGSETPVPDPRPSSSTVRDPSPFGSETTGIPDLWSGIRAPSSPGRLPSQLFRHAPIFAGSEPAPAWPCCELSARWWWFNCICFREG